MEAGDGILFHYIYVQIASKLGVYLFQKKLLSRSRWDY
jgi:hypothetical protein